VLHSLSISQKSETVLYSKLPLTVLGEQKASDFQQIITGDESRFFFNYPVGSVWVSSRDELPHAATRKLTRENARFRSKARVAPEALQNVIGVLAPHGCYSVSLCTAAKNYSRVDPDSYERVVVLGPNHHHPADGCLVSTVSALQTPFGELAVDVDTCRAPAIPMSRADNEAEHSLEMQFPMLKYVFQNRLIRVIPVVVGFLTKNQESAAVAVLCRSSPRAGSRCRSRVWSCSRP
jgi:AmmeMemoRadiSam system protein B